MKKFVCTCCNIYCKILTELLFEIKNKDNIKPIVKRKAELRVQEIKRLIECFKKGQVISYMSGLRTVEEGIYHLLAIQISEEYEKEYIKVKPDMRKSPKDFLCKQEILDNSNKLIDDEYNYLCKYAHAGEMYDMLLNLADEKKNKRIINEIFSSCISTLACNLINAFCILLGIEEIRTTELISIRHIVLSYIVMIKNINIFEKYQNNLEYDFDSVNAVSIGYMSESLKCDFEMLTEFEETSEKQSITNKKVMDEICKYQIKKEKLKYIVEYFNDNRKQLDNMAKKSKEEILEMLNEKIERKNEICNIKYPSNKK